MRTALALAAEGADEMPARGGGAVPAGWYPSPDDAAQVQYWDGTKWTDHVAPRDRHLTGEAAPAPPPRSTIGSTGQERQAAALEFRAARSKIPAVLLLTTPVLGFFLPVLGLLASAGAASWAVSRAGALLWGSTSSAGRRLGVAMLGFGALWLAAVLQLVGVLHRVLGPDDSGSVGLTAWLLIPLGGPQDPWTPAAVATVVYAVGAAASALRRRPWPWVVGGLAASLAYDLAIRISSIEFIA